MGSGGDFTRELERLAATLKRTAGDHVSLDRACRRLGITDVDERVQSVQTERGWRRTGAETYACSGFVHTSLRTIHVHVKAAVPSSLAATPSEEVDRWAEKARRLQAAGIPVVHVFGTWQGSLFSEFVEESIDQHLQRRPATQRDMIEALRHIACRLDDCGVQPTSLLPHFRVREGAPCLVDLGWDLGCVPRRPSSTKTDWCSRLVSREISEAEYFKQTPTPDSG